jgi:hypothetical protein
MTTRLRSPALGVLLLAVLAGAGQAADERPVKLRFSHDPKAKTTTPNIVVRPNVVQSIYVFVENKDDKAANVTVEVRADGKVIEGGGVDLMVEAGKTAPVLFGQPPPPKPGEKPAEKPVEKPKPPTLAELTGNLEFVLIDRDNKEKDAKPLDIKYGLTVRRPADYLSVQPTYVPTGEDGKARLEVKVTAKDNFTGPPCRVELVLRPDRAPSLDPNQPRTGTYAGFITKPGAVLNLEAEDLKFRGTDTRVNLIYLMVDGYERAFAFRAFFTPQGQLTETLQPIDVPAMRLIAPKAGDPSKPIAVNVEVDNSEENDVAVLGLGRLRKDETGKEIFTPENDELIRRFPGDRQRTLMFTAKNPAGALLFQAILRDWSAALDVKEIYGVRNLRLELLREDKPIDVYDTAVEKLEKKVPTVKAIDQWIILDATPPILGQLFFPEKLIRGKPLRLGVTASDPESGIKDVVFFLGKPDKDGNPPPTAVKVPAVADKDGVWLVSLNAPTDVKGKVDVTMIFTNKADLKEVKTVEIVLVDAPPAGPGAKGLPIITGVVTEGGRPQPKVKVFLRDAVLDVLKDSTETNDKGEYIFKDVPPGSYTVFASKTGDATRGRAATTVVDKDKKGVDIKLTR